MWIVIILGIIAFLAMEHAVALWLIFVPLAAIFILSLVGWFKNSKASFSGLISSLFILVVMIIALVFVCST